jgi:hypothetical protein
MSEKAYMSTNQQSIRLQIKSFDASDPAAPVAASSAPDPRVDQFLAFLRTRVAALDVDQREKWEATPLKTPRRKAAPPPTTPDWYETGPISPPKAKAPLIKRFATPHSYPGRRANKPKPNE